ncbi:MAG: hypothetical protein M3T49_07655 [Candidatus Eremiobacteraeota bacterium]|nr:hypothetical protein [Candidatus Eremiobacteraeota bacterium]
MTTAPPPVLLVSGAAAWCIAWRGSTRAGRQLIASLLGAGLGLTLPHVAPRPAGEVLTRSVRGASPSDLLAVLDELDADPGRVVGTLVSVSGNWQPARGTAAASISRTITACCAADAVAVGFDVYPARAIAAPPDAWLRLSGTLRVRLRSGEVRYSLVGARVARGPQRLLIREHAKRPLCRL